MSQECNLQLLLSLRSDQKRVIKLSRQINHNAHRCFVQRKSADNASMVIKLIRLLTERKLVFVVVAVLTGAL